MQIITIDNKNLVRAYRNKVLTDSLLVAEKFRKKHKNVIQKIEDLMIIDDYNGLNFQPVEYTDLKGENRKMYQMDRKSFAVLAMGFTGKKALQWKIKFVGAFEAMEEILMRHKNLEWQHDRQTGKAKRLELTSSIQKVVDLARGQGSSNADRYYTAFTKLIYGQVFNLKNVPDNFRDILDERALRKLRLIEEHAALLLDETVKRVNDYHEPYQVLKRKLTALLDVVGRLSLDVSA